MKGPGAASFWTTPPVAHELTVPSFPEKTRTVDGGHGAGFAVGQAARDVAFAIPARHGIGEDAQDLAQQLPVEGEGKSQREGHASIAFDDFLVEVLQ